MKRSLFPLLALVSCVGSATEMPCVLAQGSQPVRMAASKLAREEGKLLLKDWLHIRGAESMDGLAWRTMAFVGLVPDVDVVLDGHRNVGEAGSAGFGVDVGRLKDDRQDANALRNITYALSLIVDGRTVRPDKSPSVQHH